MVRGYALLAGTLVLSILTFQTAIAGEGQPLEERLKQELAGLDTDFQGHETVAVPEDGHPKKYLLLDFAEEETTRSDERQQHIHRICMRILKNRDLVRSLSREGFHMVSVAFDQRHQYDCL